MLLSETYVVSLCGKMTGYLRFIHFLMEAINANISIKCIRSAFRKVQC